MGPPGIPCHIGALFIRIGFWVPYYYTIIIIGEPPKIVFVFIQAPISKRKELEGLGVDANRVWGLGLPMVFRFGKYL